jgi:hypothetical protein
MVTVYVIKMSNYGDYNSTPVLYLGINLRSNFYVQTHVDNDNKKIILLWVVLVFPWE